MLSTVFNSETLYLLNDEPDWASSVEAEFSIYRDRQVGLTHRESRRPYGTSLLTKLRYTSTIRRAALRSLQGALRNITTERTVVPFWPGIAYWSDRATMPWQGGLMIVWKPDWSQFAIYTAGAEPAPIGGFPGPKDLVAPALMGVLKAFKATRLRGDAVSWPVEFTESSPVEYALTPAAGFVAAAGPRPTAYATAPLLLPFYPDQAKLSELLSVELKREQLGFTREQTQVFYPHFPERGQDGGFSLVEPMAAEMARFFADVMAPGQSFWAPSSLIAVELTADAAPADTVLDVDDTDGLELGDYLLICPPKGPAIARQAVDFTFGTLTLDAAPGEALPSGTLVFPLALSRLENPAIKLAWNSPGLATCQLAWGEVPEEIEPAANETLGTTLGALPARCFLYEFSRTLGGVTVVDRFTNCERGTVTYGGHNYAKCDLSHGEIQQGLQLDQDDVEIEAYGISTLIDTAALRMEAPLFLKIIEADLTMPVSMGIAVPTAANAVVRFSGEIIKASFTGSKLKARCVSGGTIFDRMFPGVLFQPSCNYNLFDAGCGLAKADWLFSAVMQDPGTVGYPFTFVLNTLTGVGSAAAAALAAAAVAANWFAGGWIEFGAPGPTWQARPILLSTAPVAGVLTLTLDRDPDPFPSIGDAIALYPGCDLEWTTCQKKFSNRNFGGHPYMPIGNPSAVRNRPNGGGGKK
jgi:hypothetical protein